MILIANDWSKQNLYIPVNGISKAVTHNFAKVTVATVMNEPLYIISISLHNGDKIRIGYKEESKMIADFNKIVMADNKSDETIQLNGVFDAIN